jgi:poly(3-hydroxybutyrate) depolymerase
MPGSSATIPDRANYSRPKPREDDASSNGGFGNIFGVKSLIVRAIAATAIVSSLAGTASAEIQEKSGTFGGAKMSYHVLLPPGYDRTRAYPVVLVFTGGPQTIEMALGTLETDWRQEAERRGYIVISPGAPGGNLFFEGGDRVFPDFLDYIVGTYKVQGKLHVAGHSNGGLSAFHVAAKYPQYFSTVTGYPGLLGNNPDLKRADALKSMCVAMHVGDRDEGWQDGMKQQAAQLKSRGFRVQFTVEKNQVHRLKASEINLSPRLFDEIESCK